MRGCWKRLALSGALLVLVSAAGPVEAKRLRYDCKKGDVSKYKMQMMGTNQLFVGDRIQETVLTTEMFLTQRVEDISATGVITIGTTIDSGKVVVNGFSQPLPYAGRQVQTQMLRNGEIISEGAGNPNFNNAQLVFPDKSLKPGDAWHADLPPNEQVPVPMQVRYTYLGDAEYKTTDGKTVPCVKIRSEVTTDPKKSEIEGMALKVKATGTVLFDPARGRMVRNAVESKMEMVLKREIAGRAESLITKMDMTIVLELQY